MICNICNKKCKNMRLLASHIAICHKTISPRDYTVKYFYDGITPKCGCGCDSESPYRYLGKFMTYISGHNIIVKNPFKGKHHTKKTIQKILDSDGYKNRIVKGKYQPPCTKQHRIKISEANTGKKRTAVHKLNYRISAIKRIEKNKFLGNKIITNFNPDACKIIDKYGKKHGYNFQHAMNGGEYHIKELGYFLDGYDNTKNIAIEIDERHHFDLNGKLKEKDVIRQNEIQSHLNCEFIRIKI